MQPIFSHNPDVDRTAYINWRMYPNSDILNLLNMADGFMLSAIALANKCLEDNAHKQADILIFPILTNANHGIELYLKGMVWILNIKLQSEYTIEGNHNIKQLYNSALKKIQTYQGRLSLADFKEATQDLKSYIDELFEKTQATKKDSKMDFSRYPFGRDREDHFYVTDLGNECVDLDNFSLRFTSIHESLDNLSSFLYYNELHQEEGENS